MSAAFGDDIRLAAEAIWKVLLVSILLGAGLPAVFALGIRALAWGTTAAVTAEQGGTSEASTHPLGKALAVLMFAVVAYAVVAGLIFIIATGQGKEISFAHIVPTITEKSA